MALIQKDLLPGRGDQLLTLDDITGLEWLNLTVTANHSYLDMLTGFGGFIGAFGFRYATAGEVATLYRNAGIRKLGGPVPVIDEPNHYGIEVLQDLMNGKRVSNGTVIDTAGMVSIPSSAPSPQAPMEIWQTHLNQVSHAGSYADSGAMRQKAGERSPFVGSYLVRVNVGRLSKSKRSGKRRR